MSTCKYCKHWLVEPRRSVRFGRCMAAWEVVGIAREPKELDGDPESVLDDRSMYTEDGSHASSSLYTGAEFGCNHFEPTQETS